MAETLTDEDLAFMRDYICRNTMPISHGKRLLATIARLRERVEEAEIRLGFFESAGFPTPQDILEKIDGYKALAERRACSACEAIHHLHAEEEGKR